MLIGPEAWHAGVCLVAAPLMSMKELELGNLAFLNMTAFVVGTLRRVIAFRVFFFSRSFVLSVSYSQPEVVWVWHSRECGQLVLSFFFLAWVSAEVHLGHPECSVYSLSLSHILLQFYMFCAFYMYIFSPPPSFFMQSQFQCSPIRVKDSMA